MLKIQISGKIGRTVFQNVEDAVENFMRNQKRAGYANTDALLKHGDVKVVDHLLGTSAAHYVVRLVKRGDTKNNAVAIFQDAHFGKFAVEHVTIQRAPKKVRPVAVEAPVKPEAKTAPARVKPAAKKPAAPKTAAPAKPAAKRGSQLPTKWSDSHEQQMKVLDEKTRELRTLQAIMAGAKAEGLSPAAYEQKQMRKISLVQTTYEKALVILKANGFKINRVAPTLDNVSNLSGSCGYVMGSKKVGRATVTAIVQVMSYAQTRDEKLAGIPLFRVSVDTETATRAVREAVKKLNTGNGYRPYGVLFAKHVNAAITACGGTAV